MRTYVEPSRVVQAIDEVDVLVVGGGPAGVSAAVSAARLGARTMLVEQQGGFGGTWTSGLVITLAGFNSWLRPYPRCVAGVAGEWIARAAALDGACDHEGFALSSDPEVMKLVADELVVESGARFLLHVLATYPIIDRGRVAGCLIESVNGREAVFAKVTVDCTGNGDIVARAGTDWEKGEVLQPMTMSFRMANARPVDGIDHLAPRRIPIGPEAGDLVEPALSEYASVRADVPLDIPAMRRRREAGDLPLFGGPWFGGMDKNIVWVNTTRIVGDASDVADLTRAEVAGRRESHALAEYFRTAIEGFEDVRVVQTSPYVGVRETRRLKGVHTLTGDEIGAGREFDDSVAVGCWPIDIHPTSGFVGSHKMFVPKPYGIPYRALLPRTTDGLVVAGRCVSVDREALGSVRVGATCAATGHAAGAAAALAAERGVEPRELDAGVLQRALRDQGAIVSPDEVRVLTD